MIFLIARGRRRANTHYHIISMAPAWIHYHAGAIAFPAIREKLLYSDQFVFLRADAKLLGSVEDVGSMTGVDTLNKVVLTRIAGVKHHINTGAVKGHRIKRSQNAELSHFGSSRITVAIAVDAKIVGDVDKELLLSDKTF